MTITADAPVMLALADGETREARRTLVGPQETPGIICPFCEYPSEGTACGNPGCLTWCDADALAAVRERHAAQEAEAARREAIHQFTMASMRESREASDRAWTEISAKAEEAGQCVHCLRRSYWQTRPKLVRHRDPANCPNAGR